MSQGQKSIEEDDKEKMGQGQYDQQAVNRFSGTNHEGFEAPIHFLLLEHDFEFSSGGCNGKDHLIR